LVLQLNIFLSRSKQLAIASLANEICGIAAEAQALCSSICSANIEESKSL
jgi:hypothetical protein